MVELSITCTEESVLGNKPFSSNFESSVLIAFGSEKLKAATFPLRFACSIARSSMKASILSILFLIKLLYFISMLMIMLRYFSTIFSYDFMTSFFSKDALSLKFYTVESNKIFMSLKTASTRPLAILFSRLTKSILSALSLLTF